MFSNVLTVASAVALAEAGHRGPASLAIDHLSVEHLQQLKSDGATLLGIDVPQPRFGWRLVPTVVGAREVAPAAYQIKLSKVEVTTSAASTTAAATATSAVVWDSGKVASNNTVLVQYPASSSSASTAAAPALTSNTAYTWTLTVWDAQGATATNTAEFHTGLFSRSDWGDARWVTPGLGRNLVRSPTVNLKSPVASATVFVSGVGYFELSVNGVRVGAGRRFDVAWTQ
jgi:hypothetical protein